MGKRDTNIGKRILSVIILFAIVFSLQGTSIWAETLADRKNPANPVHHCTKDTDSTGNTDITDWSYVYFGSYPQTEVTGTNLTGAIIGAEYDANGDAWVDGVRYRRISKSDTTRDTYFGDSTYRYFKWERIKWRVLKNDGSTLFVASDKGLDCKAYNEEHKYITWEKCTLRSWLNNEFYSTAFSSDEQGAIIRKSILNEDNPYYGTEGGNDTEDNVFLLSIGEVLNSELGFCEDDNIDSVSRCIKPSDYAHIMGSSVSTSSGYTGNGWWWLRSPGFYEPRAAYVRESGYVNRVCIDVNNHTGTCVPALHIDLASDSWLCPTVISPIDQNIKAEESAVFYATAKEWELDNYTYQWYYATSELGSGIEIEGANESSYVISQDQVTKKLNGRYYYCIVSNGVYEMESGRAKLTVYFSPEVTAPREHAVHKGENAVFQIIASGGNPDSYTYQWYYAASESGSGIKIEGATASTYTIPSNQVTEELNGRYYYCEVSNGAYAIDSKRAKLTVLYSSAGDEPASSEEPLACPIVISPTEQNVKAGESAVFHVTAKDGYPNHYTYQWYYVTSESDSGIELEGATESAYYIPDNQVTEDLDGRYYYCVVSNGAYEVKSELAKLMVYSKPEVIAPQDQTVTKGKNAVFQIIASGGNPDSYTYQWYYVTSESDSGIKIEGATESSYIIPQNQVTEELNGRYYYCEVSNGIYTLDSIRAKLTVTSASEEDKPTNEKPATGDNPSGGDSSTGNKPSSDSTTGNNQSGENKPSGSTPSGNSSSNGTSTGSTSGNPVSQTLKTQAIKASSFTKEYGCKPFTLNAKTTGNGKLTYKSSNKKVATVSSKGKVTVKNYGTATISIQAAKTSVYKTASAKVTIKVIPKKVTLKKATAIGDRKVSIKWKRNSVIDGYEMYMSRKSNFKSETFRRVYGKKQTSVILTGLQKGKKYYIKVRSYKKSGKKTYYGNWSKVKKVTIK